MPPFFFFALRLGRVVAVCRARIWFPPVLLPSPTECRALTMGCDAGCTLASATLLVTLAGRLVCGYLFGVVIDWPLGLLTARFKVLKQTTRLAGRTVFRRLCPALLVPPRRCCVWPEPSRYVFLSRGMVTLWSV